MRYHIHIPQNKIIQKGIAIGCLSVIRENSEEAARIPISDTKAELDRIQKAIRQAIDELHDVYESSRKQLGEEQASIFQVQAMMLEDEDFQKCIEDEITQHFSNAEYALTVAEKKISTVLSGTGVSYIEERSADVRDITKRVRSLLNKQAKTQNISTPAILYAHELLPSDLMRINPENIRGIILQNGTAQSHAAIIMRNLGIPSVICTEELAKEDGELCVLDAESGVLIINPDENQQAIYGKKLTEKREYGEKLCVLIGQKTMSRSGHSVKLFANIGSSTELPSVLSNDAEGIGLVRSELLYLNADFFPDEDILFNEYRKLFQTMNEKQVIVRTLDIGSDKLPAYFGTHNEENPALGCRGIRFCLQNPDIFTVQLRALLRAGVYGNAAIMLPMVNAVSEITETKKHIAHCVQALDKEGIPYKKNMPLGIMIETPAAALLSGTLAQYADFFSIGTNDLTQYVLAADRQNPKTKHIYSEAHPAVLELLRITVKNAQEHGIPVGVCGEAAADITLTEFFLSLGINELSVSPFSVLPLRKHIQTLP